MHIRTPFAMALAATMAATAQEGYQFICTPGWNFAAASLLNASTDHSTGIDLATGTLRTASNDSSLEARYRTIDESSPIAFRSDKWHGTIFILR